MKYIHKIIERDGKYYFTLHGHSDVSPEHGPFDSKEEADKEAWELIVLMQE